MWISKLRDRFNLKRQLLRALDALAAHERDHSQDRFSGVIALQVLVSESEFLTLDADKKRPHLLR